MATKTIHRHTIKAEITTETEYDANDPASYTAALEKVAGIRKGLTDTGAIITFDRGKPVSTKGE